MEDLRILRNRLAWKRHASRFEKQHATDASQRATLKVVRSNAQIATDIVHGRIGLMRNVVYEEALL